MVDVAAGCLILLLGIDLLAVFPLESVQFLVKVGLVDVHVVVPVHQLAHILGFVAHLFHLVPNVIECVHVQRLEHLLLLAHCILHGHSLTQSQAYHLQIVLNGVLGERNLVERVLLAEVVAQLVFVLPSFLEKLDAALSVHLAAASFRGLGLFVKLLHFLIDDGNSF